MMWPAVSPPAFFPRSSRAPASPGAFCTARMSSAPAVSDRAAVDWLTLQDMHIDGPTSHHGRQVLRIFHPQQRGSPTHFDLVRIDPLRPVGARAPRVETLGERSSTLRSRAAVQGHPTRRETVAAAPGLPQAIHAIHAIQVIQPSQPVRRRRAAAKRSRFPAHLGPVGGHGQPRPGPCPQHAIQRRRMIQCCPFLPTAAAGGQPTGHPTRPPISLAHPAQQTLAPGQCMRELLQGKKTERKIRPAVCACYPPPFPSILFHPFRRGPPSPPHVPPGHFPFHA
jgi:hypothetical protein